VDKLNIEEILRKNPQVDRRALEKAREMLREVRASGAKCKSISASPPVDPYSTHRRRRASDSRQTRAKQRR
jgi:hypothetical protein